MNTNRRLIGYVDVDDTLVRSAGSKTTAIPSVVEHVRSLANSGAELYCWSSVGGEYARDSAKKLGIESCFAAFLPKPNIVIDDQQLSTWRLFAVVHPLSASNKASLSTRN